MPDWLPWIILIIIALSSIGYRVSREEKKKNG